MKVYIAAFNHNNPDAKLEDIITNLLIGKTEEDVINFQFETKSKYLDVESTGYSYGPSYKGECITIKPIDFEHGVTTLDFYIRLIIDTSFSSSMYNSIVTSLKHAYIVSFVPDELMFNHKSLKKAEIINIIEKD